MDKQREEFEAWCKQKYRSLAYLHTSETSGKWDTWQAAQATQPAQPIKDHETAKLVSDITVVARDFHDHQSLRERVAQLVRPWAQPAHAHAIDTSPGRVEKQAGDVQVPEGWKLVPVEPTEAMLNAAARASMQHLIDCINDPKRAKETGSEEMCKITPPATKPCYPQHPSQRSNHDRLLGR